MTTPTTQTLLTFARGVDVLTFDHEHVPGEHLRALSAEGINVQPGPDALVHAQDKLVMRAAVDRLGLPNPALGRCLLRRGPDRFRQGLRLAGGAEDPARRL